MSSSRSGKSHRQHREHGKSTSVRHGGKNHRTSSHSSRAADEAMFASEAGAMKTLYGGERVESMTKKGGDEPGFTSWEIRDPLQSATVTFQGLPDQKVAGESPSMASASAAAPTIVANPFIAPSNMTPAVSASAIGSTDLFTPLRSGQQIAFDQRDWTPESLPADSQIKTAYEMLMLLHRVTYVHTQLPIGEEKIDEDVLKKTFTNLPLESTPVPSLSFRELSEQIAAMDMFTAGCIGQGVAEKAYRRHVSLSYANQQADPKCEILDRLKPFNNIGFDPRNRLETHKLLTPALSADFYVGEGNDVQWWKYRPISQLQNPKIRSRDLPPEYRRSNIAKPGSKITLEDRARYVKELLERRQRYSMILQQVYVQLEVAKDPTIQGEFRASRERELMQRLLPVAVMEASILRLAFRMAQTVFGQPGQRLVLATTFDRATTEGTPFEDVFTNLISPQLKFLLQQIRALR